jgi:hypothetical protein
MAPSNGPDATIGHFIQDGDDEVVFADGVLTGGGGDRKTAIYNESVGLATGNTKFSHFRDYALPAAESLPFPNVGDRP